MTEELSIDEQTPARLETASSSAIAGYLDVRGESVFVWVHLPHGGTARGAALLCPPLFGEHVSARATYRLVAERLARSGVVALRFDYPGTGDSSGNVEELAGVSPLVESIRALAVLARSIVDGPVVGIGMRMGALLLALAASPAAPRDSRLDGAVLWDPCESGKQFVRRQRLMSLVTDEDPTGSEELVELPGVRVSAPMVDELSALRLDELEIDVDAVFALLREEAGAPALRCASGEAQVRVEHAGGQQDLLEVEPLRHVIPIAAAERVVELVTAVTGERRSPLRRCRLSAGRSGANEGGGRYLEHPVVLGETRLFGVETLPVAPHQARGRGPVVLFLNSGNDAHVGPSRLWVELARRWAGLGVRSIRFDASGLGDSPEREGRERQVVRSLDAFDDVVEAAEAGGADASGVVLVGLCSGGYQALESAFDLRPASVLAVNPLFRFFPPELASGTASERRRFCEVPRPLERAARRLPPPLLRLIRRAVRLASGLVAAKGSPAAALEELGEMRIPCLCVGGPDELAPLFAGERRRALGASIEVETVDGLDHALLRAREREWIGGRLTAKLLDWLVE